MYNITEEDDQIVSIERRWEGNSLSRIPTFSYFPSFLSSIVFPIVFLSAFLWKYHFQVYNLYGVYAFFFSQRGHRIRSAFQVSFFRVVITPLRLKCFWTNEKLRKIRITYVFVRFRSSKSEMIKRNGKKTGQVCLFLSLSREKKDKRA